MVLTANAVLPIIFAFADPGTFPVTISGGNANSGANNGSFAIDLSYLNNDFFNDTVSFDNPAGVPESVTWRVDLNASALAYSGMLGARCNHASIALRGNRALVTGGLCTYGVPGFWASYGEARRTALIYDGSANSWSSASDMSRGLTTLRIARLADHLGILIYGANADLTSWNPVTTLIFDEGDGTFSAAADAPAGSLGGSVVQFPLPGGGVEYAAFIDGGTPRYSLIEGSLSGGRTVVLAGGFPWCDGNNGTSVAVYRPGTPGRRVAASTAGARVTWGNIRSRLQSLRSRRINA
jgi:hypothetical protein